jgi:MoaA/NifB/PqqE/SkfB family radical SAM enzyme
LEVIGKAISKDFNEKHDMISRMKKMIQYQGIRLEASTVCQLKCPSCPTAFRETGKILGVGFLKFSDFKNILDKNPWLSHIELSNWGEIFLNPELIKIMKYAHKKSVALYVGTGANLNNVKEEVLEALVKYRLRRITCSIDGASQEIYSIYRVKGNFQQVIENIKSINKFKARYKSPYPILRWQFIAFGHNEHEISKARKMAKNMNMSFKLKLSFDDLYGKPFSSIKNAELIRNETGLGVASRSEFREKYGKEYVLRNCCLILWTNPQINYEGKVLGCSINYWGDYGNAFKDGLKKCLNNEKINYARAMLMGKQKSRMDIPCIHCQSYKRMKENKNWLTNKEIYVKKIEYRLRKNKVLGYNIIQPLVRLLVLGKHRLGR